MFLNLRVVTALFPSTFAQKAVSEQINKELGKHLDGLLALFGRLNVKAFSKPESQRPTPNSKEVAEQFLEKLEVKQQNLITDELTRDAMAQLNFGAVTDYTLLKHQEQGLIWMLERENFYEHNSNNPRISFSNVTTKSLKGFLNPLWNEYTLDADFRCNARLRRKVESKIRETNPKNANDDNKMVLYFHKMTGQIVLEFPHVGCHINFFGGLVADEMGMGKTILVLSLVGVSKLFNTPHQTSLLSKFDFADADVASRVIQDYSTKDLRDIERRQSAFRLKSRSKGKLRSTGYKSKTKPKSRPRKNKKKKKKKTQSTRLLGGNLIIVPTILMAQWEDEIKSFYKKVGGAGSGLDP